MTFRQIPVLFVLIGLNALVFLAQQIGWDARDVGALWLPLSPYYHHWQWLTHQFLHDNVLHIVFNMYALGLFGAPLVRLWGAGRFVLLYLISGVLAAACYAAWQIHLVFQAAHSDVFGTQQAVMQLLATPMLGASGAVFGVVAAFAMRLPHVKLGLMFIPIHLPARVFVALILVYELFAQFSGVSLFGDNIAHLAHVGGALAGGVFGYVWMRQEQRVLHKMLPENHEDWR